MIQIVTGEIKNSKLFFNLQKKFQLIYIIPLTLLLINYIPLHTLLLTLFILILFHITILGSYVPNDVERILSENNFIFNDSIGYYEKNNNYYKIDDFVNKNNNILIIIKQY